MPRYTDIVLFPELKGTEKPDDRTRMSGQPDTSKKRREWSLANGRCPMLVHRSRGRFGFSEVCDRPIKTDDVDICNMHLGHEQRRELRDQKQRDKDRALNESMRVGTNLAAKFKALGFDAFARHQGVYLGQHAAEDIIAALKKETK